ncbi:HNH endonuclease family protein [Streptomyces sp. NPDC005728]|uniref:HNH endonuclease family protein n=1 Tax=Streptomyces sp. NPDC005728 TaxID=3157054 RepID=UPI0033D65B0A
MAKNFPRVLSALALLFLPALASPTAMAATRSPAAATAPARSFGSGHRAASETVSLFTAVSRLPVEEEPDPRVGYDRDKKFPHWTAGLILNDGCDTRKEVILQEAVEAPEVGPKCRLIGGRWFSAYDQKWLTSASSIDVDHMVPLAEAWDSGAASWTQERRRAYANDQGVPASLIAVSGGSNRQKADKDPADWLPVAAYRCQYVADWVATKLRWGLSADAGEVDALSKVAEDCPTQEVTYVTAG